MQYENGNMFNDSQFRIDFRRIVKNEINDYWSNKRPNRQSVRLSPSSLGEECAAQTWYRWRWAVSPPTADGRMARYNSRGEENEIDIVEWLKATGWIVYEIDPTTNEQFVITYFNGHLYGKLDTIASHPIHTNGIAVLFEYKYINQRRFSTLTTKPLMEADLKYYNQVQLYLHFRQLPACVFFPVSRNDEDFEPIIIPYDNTQVSMTLEKAQAIMNAKIRPARIAENPTFHACKFCDFVEPCHKGKQLLKSCRSCVNCVPINDGKFGCEMWKQVIPTKEAIIAACDMWEPVS